MNAPQCIAGSFAHPGCAAGRLQEELRESERVIIDHLRSLDAEKARLQNAAETIVELADENKELRAALLELVACKDLKERITLCDFATFHAAGTAAADYERRKPLAWERARAVLRGECPQETTDSPLAAHEIVCAALERWRNRAIAAEARLYEAGLTIGGTSQQEPAP